ncbi:MAG: sugar phosphate isomerase/epimerase [Bacteroidales bacterium]
MKTRREFIRSLSLLTVSAMALRAFPISMAPGRMIGLQLWTLRNAIQEHTMETLKQVGRIGYDHIEPYGFDGEFYGYPAKAFRKITEDLGMKLTSTHTGITLSNADLHIEQAVEAGLEYLVLPTPGDRKMEDPDDVKIFAEEMNRIGEKVQKAGMKLGYHNHSFEFQPMDGEIPFDILLRETIPELVCFQLDIYWMIEGGRDPVRYFQDHPGRFELWHVKDRGGDGKSTTVGNGTIDYADLFHYSGSAGMKYFYVEQESYTMAPIEAAAKSYAFIRENLL